jgi:diguanylate cyclase (GGDEF)-like protein
MADSGPKALDLMEDHEFFLILTDQRMPKMLGTEFLEESIKKDPAAIRILITGYSDIESVIDGINKGAVHRYIKKPWNRDELKREIQMSVEIHRLTMENQQLVKKLKESNLKLREHERLLAKDLDERTKELYRTNEELRHANETLQNLTLQDGLTGLYNHRGFQQRLREEFYRAQRAKKHLSLIFFDLDHFKNYNDTNGHPAGDELLRNIAKLLTEDSRTRTEDEARIRISDIPSRYGGEEFAILLPETPLEGARIKAERIRKRIEGYEFEHMASQPGGRVTVSVGVACFPDDADKPQLLVDRSDQAMYVAKTTGRNQVKLFRDIPESK